MLVEHVARAELLSMETLIDSTLTCRARFEPLVGVRLGGNPVGLGCTRPNGKVAMRVDPLTHTAQSAPAVLLLLESLQVEKDSAGRGTVLERKQLWKWVRSDMYMGMGSYGK